MRNFAIAIILVAAYTAGAHAQAPRTATDSLAAMTVMYTKAVDNGMRTAHAAEKPTLICVGGFRNGPPPGLLAALSNSGGLLIRAASACRIEPLRSPSTGQSLVVDTLSGRRGIEIRVSHVAFGESGALFFRTHYYENGRSGADWDCTGARRGETWEIVSCLMTRTS